MKFLITGGLGFIGSNFIEKLFEAYPNSSVQNIDAELFGSNRKNLEQLEKSKKYNSIKGNIKNFKLMKKLITKRHLTIPITWDNPFLTIPCRELLIIREYLCICLKKRH